MSRTAQSPEVDRLVHAILPHVAFDGWSDVAFAEAVRDVGMSREAARALCPRGAVDLAVAFHKAGDAAMVAAVEAADLGSMRYSDRVSFAIRARLAAAADKEAVRRGSALFALPHLAAEGAALIWGTADTIWTSLGDTSTDGNWYTKRATLAAVYASTVLFWLGDDSFEEQATDDFIDRRIDNVMQVEKIKAQVNAMPLLKPVTAPFAAFMERVRAPSAAASAEDLPGRWTQPR
ncbi:COQ9 family protein [Flavimaricola marinus]|uniref:COQ9 C-terminal domain-containing protein n=1 Tax=Flavimaricola marinus TaxID=1819565 RepID=A0A238LAR8_9RHOB|nr:COQ9 family protein [Flavimaricola marinus]SMY06769.1 hypothetical protein LOM8899_00899 [Flavimaricola marinus]